MQRAQSVDCETPLWNRATNGLITGTTKKSSDERSGIVHHLAFKKTVLDDLVAQVERIHGETFWRAILRQVAHKDPSILVLSEYEMYFDFARSSLKHRESVVLRQLNWANGPRPKMVLDNVFAVGTRTEPSAHFFDRNSGENEETQILRDRRAGFHYVAYHMCVRLTRDIFSR